MGFTTPCFIRKYTPELRKNLEKLGYKMINSSNTTLDAHNYDGKGNHKSIEEGRAIITSEGDAYGIIYDVDAVTKMGRIDCGTNEFLFFAIAALKDDTDSGQVFVNGKGDWGIRRDFNNGSIMEYLYLPNDFNEENYHKASVEELIEIFKGMEE